MFKFDRKFGVSEILSLLAVIMSAVALLQSHQNSSPSIHIQQREATRYVGGGGTLYFAIPISITNVGGRTVTLARIEHSDQEPVVFTRRPDRAYVDDLTVDAAIKLIPGTHNNRDELGRVFRETLLDPLELPYFLDVEIEPGTQQSAVLLVRLQPREGRNLNDEFVAFCVTLRFSNGSKFRLAFANSPTT